MSEQERIQAIRENGGLHLKYYRKENITYEMCLVAMQSNGEALTYVPRELRTEEIYREACRTYGLALSVVPQEFLTPAICAAAVENNGEALQYVPKEWRTKEICEKAMRSSFLALQHTPVEFITPEWVVAAPRKFGYKLAFKYMPKSIKKPNFFLQLLALEPDYIWYASNNVRTAAVCEVATKAMGYSSTLEAVKANPRILSRFPGALYDHETSLAFVQSEYFQMNYPGRGRYDMELSGFNTSQDRQYGRLYIAQKYDETYSLPELMKWPDVALLLLKYDGSYLRYVKPKTITEEMCDIAVNADGTALEFVPNEFKTADLCCLAFKNRAYAIEYVPAEFITEEMALTAVKFFGSLLQYLPSTVRTHEVCLTAIASTRDFHLIKEVPDDVIDKEISLAWLPHTFGHSDALQYIPERLRDYEVCSVAVATYGLELEMVPKDLIDEKLCQLAIQKSLAAVKYFPVKYVSMDLIKQIIKEPYYFDVIPKQLLTEEICMDAVKNTVSNADRLLREIPAHLLTVEMCDRIVKITPETYLDIPDHLISYRTLMFIAGRRSDYLSRKLPVQFRNHDTIDKLLELNDSTYMRITLAKAMADEENAL